MQELLYSLFCLHCINRLSLSDSSPDIASMVRRNYAHSHVLTQTYVHVHHINYNDFSPLISEQDLNYRYPLRGPKRRRRKKNSKTGRKGNRESQRDRGNEIGQWRGLHKAQAVITGCAQTFQESDASEILGSWVNLASPLSSLSSLCLLSLSITFFFFSIFLIIRIFFHFIIVENISINQSTKDSNRLICKWRND